MRDLLHKRSRCKNCMTDKDKKCMGNARVHGVWCKTARDTSPVIVLLFQHHGLKNKVVPLLSESISGSMWKKILEYKNADCALPLLIFGDFYSSRREEQNKFLVDVSHIKMKKSIGVFFTLQITCVDALFVK